MLDGSPDSKPPGVVSYSRDYPSDDYLRALLWARQYHLAKKVFDGTRCFHSYPTLRALCRQHQAQSLLDYGCGKGLQYQAKNLVIDLGQGKEGLPSLLEGLDLTPAQVFLYDPAWQPYARWDPSWRADGVLCHDALQYIAAPDLLWVLEDIFQAARKFVLLQVSCEPGKKPWGDQEANEKGRPESFWLDLLNKQLWSWLARGKTHSLDVVLRVRGWDPEQAKKCRLWRSQGSDELTPAGDDNLIWPPLESAHAQSA